MINNKNAFPILPLRDVVVFPGMVLPLFVGRKRSIKAIEVAMENQKNILLVAQKSPSNDDPKQSDMYNVGSIASILQMLKLPDGTVKVLVEGLQRAEIQKIDFIDDYQLALANTLEQKKEPTSEIEAMKRALLSQFDQYVKLNKKIPSEILSSITSIEEPEKFVDTVAAHLPLKIDQKQEVLEMESVKLRYEHLLKIIESELDILQVEKKIRGRVKRQMEKSQREYYLNEQAKAIQKELGDSDDSVDIEEIEEKLKTIGLSKEAKSKASSELKKLKMMSPMSAEATVVRNYLDTIIALPWKKKSKINADMIKAQKILDEDHSGLEKIKERILEYLAVQRRVKVTKSPILCLVGPPGVGKTSLGQSIARAVNRKFVRMSLGGVRDESEIRGHRRTYIGSMPGKILQNISKIGVNNPLFLLDEVDKIGMDFRGDPASALLEVLDPEQNNKFSDHYLEIDYDLSNVMFVATANNMNIPPALLDRMEVIRLSGYTEDEKVNIANDHLVKKQIENNGLKKSEVKISSAVLKDIIRFYTREAGVRGLEREISKLFRKVVRQIDLEEKLTKVNLTSKNLSNFLGVRKFKYGTAEKSKQVGQVTGLAWTEVGGELLTIESVVVPGKGLIQRTGSLGDVMKESMDAARSIVRFRANLLGISKKVFEENDIHVHVPEGATPKDGPSAGIAITTALISSITNIPVKSCVAMTGEITLRGEVLAIGGLKEKLLAALRGGIKIVLIPIDNEKDLVEIPDNIKGKIKIIPVKWIDEVISYALDRIPDPITEAQEVNLSKVKNDERQHSIKH